MLCGSLVDAIHARKRVRGLVRVLLGAQHATRRIEASLQPRAITQHLPIMGMPSYPRREAEHLPIMGMG
jgi:hypothetical protein